MNRSGFTLLEVVLAMALLAMATVCVMGVQVTAAQARARTASSAELARLAAESMPVNLGESPVYGQSPCRLFEDVVEVGCRMSVTACASSGHPLCSGIWSSRATLVELELTGRHETSFALATLLAVFPP